MPKKLCILANCIQRIVSNKFKSSKYNAIANLIFLRLYCPYLTDSTKWSSFIQPNEPHLKLTVHATNNCKHVSRILQKLANGTRFTIDDSKHIDDVKHKKKAIYQQQDLLYTTQIYQQLNQFLDTQEQKIQHFLYELANPSIDDLLDVPYLKTTEQLIIETNTKLKDFERIYQILKNSTLLQDQEWYSKSSIANLRHSSLKIDDLYLNKTFFF